MRALRRNARSGFTLVEALIGTALIGLILGSAVLVQRTGIGAYRSTATRTQLQAEARRALDRIAHELTTAALDTLSPAAMPMGADALTFTQVVDAVNGDRVFGPTMRVAMDVAGGRLLLIRDSGGANERTIVLSRSVAPMAPGEVQDLDDTNGNGLVDERGFNVVRVGETVVLRLTLTRMGLDGREVVHSMETSVRLRN